VQIAREVFAKGNEFATKITYRPHDGKADDLGQLLRNSLNPRIVVTVDMIATGTDVKPLECLLFMRSVKSRTYFEQVIGVPARWRRAITVRGSRGLDVDLVKPQGQGIRADPSLVLVRTRWYCQIRRDTPLGGGEHVDHHFERRT